MEDTQTCFFIFLVFGNLRTLKECAEHHEIYVLHFLLQRVYIEHHIQFLVMSATHQPDHYLWSISPCVVFSGMLSFSM